MGVRRITDEGTETFMAIINDTMTGCLRQEKESGAQPYLRVFKVEKSLNTRIKKTEKECDE